VTLTTILRVRGLKGLKIGFSVGVANKDILVKRVSRVKNTFEQIWKVSTLHPNPVYFDCFLKNIL